MGGRLRLESAANFVGMRNHRGGTPESVRPLAKRMQAIYRKYGVAYRVGLVQTGDHAGEWLVIVQYPDEATYAKVPQELEQDPEYQAVIVEIRKVVTQTSREVVTDLEL
jgi:hypothetical protein